MGIDEPPWDSYHEGNEQGVPSVRASSPSTPFRPRQGGSLFRLYPSPQWRESSGGGGGPHRAYAIPTLHLSWGPWGPRIPCKDGPKSASRLSQTSSPFALSVLLRSDCWAVCTLTGPRETVWGRGGQSLEVWPGEIIPRRIGPLTMRAEPGVEGEAG